MSKSLIIYIAVALLLLFLIQFGPQNSQHHGLHRRVGPVRLKLRSSFTFSKEKHDPVAFDPLIANIERHREDKEWKKQYFEHAHKEFLADSAPGHESQPEWEDFMHAEDYVNDDERFNVTNRLVVLFPNIDLDPVDGFVSSKELTEWNVKQAMKEVMHRTERDLELHDKNRDGFVSFDEYEAPSWSRISDNNSYGFMTGWWKEDHFNASDEDGDGLLNRTEFNNFLHPSDSNNPRLLRWLCKEEVRERDTDKDGKLEFQEFFHGLFDLIRNYDEVDSNSSHGSDSGISDEAPAKKLFAELDQDNDGYLSEGELLPIISKLHPGEHYYAKQQADYAIMQADTDKDGRLTLQEMVNSPYVFYSAIFTNEDDYEYHDEFR